MMCIQILSLLLILTVYNVHSAKILGVSTIASISHQIVFHPIWKELSLRGHEVTVLSPNPLKDPSLTNLTEIDLGFMYKVIESVKGDMSKGMNHWTLIQSLSATFAEISSKVFSSEEVLNFIKDDSKSYDVVLVEMMDPTTYAFATKFKCPIIGIASFTITAMAHEAVGNPAHPVLHPDFHTPYYGGELNFLEKIDALLFDWYARYAFNNIYYPKITAIAKQYFGDSVPDVQDIQKNISMVFLNTNPIIHGVRPYGPNVIEFGGGVHLKPPKHLPSELKTFLDNATKGVIYFSLGSNVKSVYLPKNKREILIRTFAKLPYKVLWKFEDDQLEGKPENVKINKWLPQQDILRHPNIKLFITQAGLQSTEEALLNGVPLLAIPFMADQHFNARSIEKLEVGLQVSFQSISEEKFCSSILEIIENSK